MSNAACRFDNIEVPDWVPHFDFMKEVEEVLKTDGKLYFSGHRSG